MDESMKTAPTVRKVMHGMCTCTEPLSTCTELLSTCEIIHLARGAPAGRYTVTVIITLKILFEVHKMKVLSHSCGLHQSLC